MYSLTAVIPAKAQALFNGACRSNHVALMHPGKWSPAFAGMTDVEVTFIITNALTCGKSLGPGVRRGDGGLGLS
jgi:hypothetical protein